MLETAGSKIKESEEKCKENQKCVVSWMSEKKVLEGGRRGEQAQMLLCVRNVRTECPSFQLGAGGQKGAVSVELRDKKLNGEGETETVCTDNSLRNSVCMHVRGCGDMCVPVCICVYVHVYICMCMCTHVRIYLCVYMRVCLYMFVCVHARVYTSVCTRMCICLCVCVCIYVWVYVCACAPPRMCWWKCSGTVITDVVGGGELLEQGPREGQWSPMSK